MKKSIPLWELTNTFEYFITNYSLAKLIIIGKNTAIIKIIQNHSGPKALVCILYWGYWSLNRIPTSNFSSIFPINKLINVIKGTTNKPFKLLNTSARPKQIKEHAKYSGWRQKL